MFRHNRFDSNDRERSRNLSPNLTPPNSMTSVINKSSPMVTPTRPVYRRYSLADTMSYPKYNSTPRNQSNSPNTSYNTLISTQLDTKSPGFSSRLVQYNAEKEKSLAICQSKYDKLGVFPIVHFFKKDLPRRKPNIINTQCNSSDLVKYNSPEHNRMLLEKIIKTNPANESVSSLNDEANTKSVLDALKEISRKRIHSSEDDFMSKENGKRIFLSYDNEGVSRKRVKQNLVQDDGLSKKVCMMDELGASRSSSEGLLDEKPQKKQKLIGRTSSPEKAPACPKGIDVETQTPSLPTPVLPPAELIQEQHKENENVDTNAPTKPIKPPRASPVKIFDDSRLETLRRNRLSVLLGSLAPVRSKSEKSEEDKSEEKTEKPLVSILAGANKSPLKNNKHVTFNIPETSVETQVPSAVTTVASNLANSSIENLVTRTSPSLVTPITSTSIVETSSGSQTQNSNETATAKIGGGTSAFSESGKPEIATTPILNFAEKPQETINGSTTSTGFTFGKTTDIQTLSTSSNSPPKGGFKFDLKEPLKSANTPSPSFNFKPVEETKKEVTSSFSANVSPFSPPNTTSKENSTTFNVPSTSASASQATGLSPNKFSFGKTPGVGENTVKPFNFMSASTPPSSINKNAAASNVSEIARPSSPFTTMKSPMNFPTNASVSPFQTVTSVPSFSTTATPGFLTTATPSFSATATPSFSATAVSALTTTTASSFSTTATPGFSATATPSFSATATPGFSASGSHGFSTNPVSPNFTANASASNLFKNVSTTNFTPNFATNTSNPSFSTKPSTPNFTPKVATPSFSTNASVPSFSTTTSTPAFSTNVSTTGFPSLPAPSFSTNVVPGFGTNISTTSTPNFSANTSSFATPNSTNKPASFSFGSNNIPAGSFTSASTNIFDSAPKNTTSSSSIFPTTTTSAAPGFAQSNPAFSSFPSTFNKPGSNAFNNASSGLPPAFPGNVTESQPAKVAFGAPTTSFNTNAPAFVGNTNNTSIFGPGGGPTKSIFGQGSSAPMFGTATTTTAATNSFGNVTTTTNSIFGGFGVTATTTASPFAATKTSSFGSSGLGSSNFGSTQSPAFGSGSNNSNRPFGAPSNPTFGASNANPAAPGFSANSSGFGSFTSTGNFGQNNNSFGNSSGFNAPSPFDIPAATNPEPPAPTPFVPASGTFGTNFSTNQAQPPQGEVFTFGGGTANSKSAVFSFGNGEPSKPTFNFSADNNANAFGANKSFGAAPPAFNTVAPTPQQFGLQPNVPGMFNIGTGGSTTPNRSRVMHKAKRRT